MPKIPYYRLEDLLAQIKPGDKPPPFVDWGPDVGAEILPDEDWSDIAPTDEADEDSAWQQDTSKRYLMPERSLWSRLRCDPVGEREQGGQPARCS